MSNTGVHQPATVYTGTLTARLVVCVLHEITAHLLLLLGYFAQETEFGNEV